MKIRNYGVSMGSPGSYQRRLSSLKQPLSKQASWDSDPASFVSSQHSQSSLNSSGSGSGLMGYPSQPTALTGFHSNRSGFGGSNPPAGSTDFVQVPFESDGVPGSQAPGLLAGDPRWNGDLCVERQAQAYRSAASGATAAAVWSGVLPPRNTKGSAFSCKVRTWLVWTT